MSKLRKQGFTLIELLVVIAIISIMSSLLVMSVRSTESRSPVDVWLKELNERVVYLLDISVLKNKNYSIQFYANQLRFMTKVKGRWRDSNDEFLTTMSYPKGAIVNLYTESNSLFLKDNSSFKRSIVFIDPLAMMTPFELHIEYSNKKHIVKYGLSGKVTGDEL